MKFEFNDIKFKTIKKKLDRCSVNFDLRHYFNIGCEHPCFRCNKIIV